MKTSLVCLLLLAAVVCAAPQTKQTGKARLLQKIKEARLLQEAKKARISDDAGEEAVAAVEAGEDAEAKERYYCPPYPCYYGPRGEPWYWTYFYCPYHCEYDYDYYSDCSCCDPYCYPDYYYYNYY